MTNPKTNQVTLKLTITLLALLFVVNSNATEKVIYGVDDRVDVFEATNQKHVELSKSTAAMIPSYKIKSHNSYESLLSGNSLEEGGKCASEKFAEQPTVANCSGFLVAKNKIVTAGHCITSEADCKSNSWVFDYKVSYSSQGEVIVDNSKVYKCKSIISRSLDGSTQNDYALIELEESVEDRKPLKFRTTGKAKVGDSLVVIGHPTGLPTKIAAGAEIRTIGDVFFTANLDTYGGNSGSAVFNATTGVVEGILVRGDTDYVWSSSQGCQVSNVISSTGGRGEDVTLITNIKELSSIAQEQEEEEEEEEVEEVEVVEPVKPDYSHLPYWLRRWLGLA
jgi:V8-like Glu-specific endopeptidase